MDCRLARAFPVGSHPLWERACSRIRRVSRHGYCLTLRFREQARSHRVLRCPDGHCACRSGLVGAAVLAAWVVLVVITVCCFHG
ncbi:hypothetical protein C6Y56_10965 [Pseudomonas fluorescens]|uniref:Uncharacterized protein n=1 Tax=Pseudomonas fluorescens TaxID=294 RepID=A0A7Z3C4E8_PSEFL|nr:hypothetical protein C6Y56_10965 [Pseudomonas fluorescens]